MARPISDHDVRRAVLAEIARRQPRTLRVLKLKSVDDLAVAERQVALSLHLDHGKNAVKIPRPCNNVKELRLLRDCQSGREQRKAHSRRQPYRPGPGLPVARSPLP